MMSSAINFLLLCVLCIAGLSSVLAARARERGGDTLDLVDTRKSLHHLLIDDDASATPRVRREGEDTVIEIQKRDNAFVKMSSSLSSAGSSTKSRQARSSGDDVVHSRTRRATDFTASDIDAIVAKHNEQRGSLVEPVAANMETMTWDSTLAEMAQQWTDACVYEHGQPTNISPFSSQGQNLYIKWGLSSPGTPPDGTSATQAWFNEHVDFDFDTNSCAAGRVCGHYTQNVWASSYAVGCGLSFCDQARDDDGNTYDGAWYITCNYGPPGNYVGTSPYIAGSACTKCESGVGLCYEGLCSDCSLSDEGCECRADCKNCGTLQSDCTCSCPDGWYGPDCSSACENTHANCGANPGWPTSWCDDEHSYVLTNCPLMCGLCNAANPDFVCTSPNSVTQTPTTMPHMPTTRQSIAATTKATSSSFGTRASNAPQTVATTSTLSTTGTVAPTTPTSSSAGPSCLISTCLHNSDFEEATCSCDCAQGYNGDICQYANNQNSNGVRVLLFEEIANWGAIQADVLTELQETVINYCKNGGQTTCCPAALNDIVDFDTTGLTLHDDYPTAELNYDSPALWIQVAAISPVDPGVCDIDDGGFLSSDVVIAALEGDKSSLEASLGIELGEIKKGGASRLSISLQTVFILVSTIVLNNW